MSNQYLNDLKVGQTFKTNGATITESDIIGFALKYDPQPFHLDVVEAAKIAPWRTNCQRFPDLGLLFPACLSRREYFLSPASVHSGIDELRWLAPVRPGDTLYTEVDVLEVRPRPQSQTAGLHG